MPVPPSTAPVAAGARSTCPRSEPPAAAPCVTTEPASGPAGSSSVTVTAAVVADERLPRPPREPRRRLRARPASPCSAADPGPSKRPGSASAASEPAAAPARPARVTLSRGGAPSSPSAPAEASFDLPPALPARGWAVPVRLSSFPELSPPSWSKRATSPSPGPVGPGAELRLKLAASPRSGSDIEIFPSERARSVAHPARVATGELPGPLRSHRQELPARRRAPLPYKSLRPHRSAPGQP